MHTDILIQTGIADEADGVKRLVKSIVSKMESVYDPPYGGPVLNSTQLDKVCA